MTIQTSQFHAWMSMDPSGRWRARFATSLVLAAGLAVVACAAPRAGAFQNAPPAEAGKPSALPAPTETDLYAATQIVRLALLDLRAADQPSEREYRIAAHLLALAESFSPSDPEIVRRRVEAAWNAGDDAIAFEATRRLVELDRTDTVAQLRLISAKLAQMQTAEDRLAAYDKLLGAAGAGFDPSVRSRLALDAALLVRERGDERAFADRLKLAAQLDPANKEAALLTLNFITENVSDPVARLQATSNLLIADPLDPNVHMRLAQELARAGAHSSAKRFHAIAIDLARQSAEGPPAEWALEREVLVWLLEGPKTVHSKLVTDLSMSRARASAVLADRERQLLDISNATKVEDMRLRLEIEPLRFATAVAMGDTDAALASLADAAKSTDARFAEAVDPQRRGEDVTEEAAVAAARAALFEMQLWRAATGLDPARLASEDARATEGLDPQAADVIAYRAMVTSASGDHAGAKVMLDAVVQPTPWVGIARGVAFQGLNDAPAAAMAYRDAADAGPLSIPGAFAVFKFKSLASSPAIEAMRNERDAGAAKLARVAQSVPAWVDDMATNPRSFQSMLVSVDRMTANAIEPVKLKITLTNTARIPLGLGSGRTINSRLLFSPAVEANGRPLRTLIQPEVFDAEQRLRLRPGETLELSVTPDLGPTGWITETLSGVPVRTRWRVIQGFEARANGDRGPGPGCLEGSTDVTIRTSLPETKLKAGELAVRIANANEAELGATLAAARFYLLVSASLADEAEGRTEVIAALASRFGPSSPRARIMMLCAVPNRAEVADLAAFDDAVRQAIDKDAQEPGFDPRVLALAVISRAATADDTLLKHAAASGDESTRAIAALHVDRLNADVKSFARDGSGLMAQIPAALNPPQARPTVTPR